MYCSTSGCIVTDKHVDQHRPSTDAGFPARRTHGELDDRWQPEDDRSQSAAPRWQRTAHPIDFRVSIWMPLGGYYYFAFFAGPERRNPERLRREGQTLSSRRALLLIAVACMIFGAAAFSGIAFLYIIKSAIAIDLMQGDSFLHPLFDIIFN